VLLVHLNGYYKQHHVHLDVFYRAIQMQHCHKESYRVVAVEGIHPEEWFVFETQTCPEIESVVST
jgi:hypothetical protein